MFKKKLDISLKSAIESKEKFPLRIIINYDIKLKKKLLSFLKRHNSNVIYEIDEMDLIVFNTSSEKISSFLYLPEIKNIVIDSLLVDHKVSLSNQKPKNVFRSNNLLLEKNSKFTGKDVNVAILSTGIYPSFDFSKNSNIKFFMDTISDYKVPYDNIGTGTILSTILSSPSDSSSGFFRSISPNLNLYVSKIIDINGFGYISDLIYSTFKILENVNLNILMLPFEFPPNEESLNMLLKNFFDILSDKNIFTTISNQISSLSSANFLDNVFIPGSQKDKKVFNFNYKLENTGSSTSNTFYKPRKNQTAFFYKNEDIIIHSFNGTSLALPVFSSLLSLLIEENPSIKYKDIISFLLLFSEDNNNVLKKHFCIK